MNSDDPAVWLVEEFGADSNHLEKCKCSIYWISMPDDGGTWLVTYYSDHGDWEIMDYTTDKALTRDDVRRLCEIFGVEVGK